MRGVGKHNGNYPISGDYDGDWLCGVDKHNSNIWLMAKVRQMVMFNWWELLGLWRQTVTVELPAIKSTITLPHQ